MDRGVIFHVIAFFTGFFAAFFTILPSIFSDGGTTWERVFTFFLVAVVYLTISTVYGYINTGRRSYVSIMVPAIALVLLFLIIDSPDSAPGWILNISYVLIAVSASVAGDRIGGTIKANIDKRSMS